MNIKEKKYYDALLQNYKQNGDDSFLSILFECIPFEEDMRPFFDEEIENSFNKSYQKIIKESEILFVMRYATYFGKYKDVYWASDEDGNLSFAGKSIDNIIYFAFSFWTGDFFDKRQEEDRIIDIENKGYDYQSILLKYKKFCNHYGYDFNLKWHYDEQEEQNFNSLIGIKY